MINKIIYPFLEVRPGFWICLYAVLQSFLYFQPYDHSTAGAFYFLAYDGQLFPADTVRTSTLGTSTVFYHFMHLVLGDKMIDPFYLFIPYLITCLLIAWSVYLVGELISGGKKGGGILMLAFLLVEKQAIEGAYVSLIRSDYNYQHFTLPILFFSIYFLLKEKYFYSTLLLAISLYFHLKTPVAIVLALIPFFIYKIYKNLGIIRSLIFPFLVALPKVFSVVAEMGNQSFTPPERKEFLDLMIHREQIEGSMYLNQAGITNLIVYLAITAIGLWTTRFVQDRNIRRIIYWGHAGVFFAFGIGILLFALHHFWRPLGEVVVMGYSRASILGLLFTTATVSLYFSKLLESGLYHKRSLWMFVLLFIFLFVAANNLYCLSFSSVGSKILGVKTLSKLLFALIAAGVIVYAVKSHQYQFSPSSLAMLVLLVALSFVSLKGVAMVYRSYKMGYPYFPFNPGLAYFDKDLQEAGDWARNHTEKSALFLVIAQREDETINYCPASFRNKSMRSVWCSDLVGAYGNVAAFREWKRREDIYKQHLKMPFEQWASWIPQENIDYVLLPKGLVGWREYKVVFENKNYIIYSMKKEI
ncbi:MAG: hypothetical protein A3D87_03365 [Omnitrophica WOR_2 bacterium RIFCSPHIGHO2_02_FULL_50_17]|nr:MAG: hypothetical protein A3D87_03365 [Omnitrophica WOR_2 bacterium RIFCSPHIGHO2_02_FULL_50_17]